MAQQLKVYQTVDSFYQKLHHLVVVNILKCKYLVSADPSGPFEYLFRILAVVENGYDQDMIECIVFEKEIFAAVNYWIDAKVTRLATFIPVTL